MKSIIHLHYELQDADQHTMLQLSGGRIGYVKRILVQNQDTTPHTVELYDGSTSLLKIVVDAGGTVNLSELSIPVKTSLAAKLEAAPSSPVLLDLEVEIL